MVDRQGTTISYLAQELENLVILPPERGDSPRPERGSSWDQWCSSPSNCDRCKGAPSQCDLPPFSYRNKLKQEKAIHTSMVYASKWEDCALPLPWTISFACCEPVVSGQFTACRYGSKVDNIDSYGGSYTSLCKCKVQPNFGELFPLLNMDAYIAETMKCDVNTKHYCFQRQFISI